MKSPSIGLHCVRVHMQALAQSIPPQAKAGEEWQAPHVCRLGHSPLGRGLHSTPSPPSFPPSGPFVPALSFQFLQLQTHRGNRNPDSRLDKDPLSHTTAPHRHHGWQECCILRGWFPPGIRLARPKWNHPLVFSSPASPDPSVATAAPSAS